MSTLTQPSTPTIAAPDSVGTLRGRRRWPWLAGAAVVLGVAALPVAAAAAVTLTRAVPPGAARLDGGGGGLVAAVGDWPGLVVGMLTDPADASGWGPAGVGVIHPVLTAALAGGLWLAAAVAALALIMGWVGRRRRPGTARPRDLRPLRVRAVVASTRQTRPATALPRPRWVLRRAWLVGLHQYGPRIGVLAGPVRVALRARHEDSTIAVAPPRGHKTAAVVIPRVLDAPGPVVSTSTKADVLLATGTRRAELGTVWVLDAETIAQPLPPGWRALTWDPLEGCTDPDTAIRRASVLVGARPLGAVRNADFFSAAASGVLRCWLLAAALAGYRLPELHRWLHNLHDTTPADILDGHGSSWGEQLRALAANPGGEMVGGLLGTLSLVLSPLASPRIAAACSADHGFAIADFLGSADSLYLLTEGNPDGAAPFVTALVDEVMHQGRRASQHRPGQRLDPPLAMVLDEPANTAAMPNMPTYMSDSGGRGITLTLAPQGWAQMQRRWGADGAREIWNSATLALVMGGSKETQFLQELSGLAGEYQRRRTSHSRGSGGRSRQHSEHPEPVFRVGDLRLIGDGRALMLYQRLPAAVIELPSWFRGPQAAQLRADLAAVHAARTR